MCKPPSGCCGMAMFADAKGTVRALYRSATESVHRDVYQLTSIDHARSFQGRELHTYAIAFETLCQHKQTDGSISLPVRGPFVEQPEEDLLLSFISELLCGVLWGSIRSSSSRVSSTRR